MLPGEFDIAHSVVSRLWKSFKTTGMCSRRHRGGRVRSTMPAEDRYIVLSAKGTGALQLSRQVAGRNYPPTNKNTLIRALTEEWDKLPQQLLDNVVQTVYYPEDEDCLIPDVLLDMLITTFIDAIVNMYTDENCIHIRTSPPDDVGYPEEFSTLGYLEMKHTQNSRFEGKRVYRCLMDLPHLCDEYCNHTSPPDNVDMSSDNLREEDSSEVSSDIASNNMNASLDTSDTKPLEDSSNLLVASNNMQLDKMDDIPSDNMVSNNMQLDKMDDIPSDNMVSNNMQLDKMDDIPSDNMASNNVQMDELTGSKELCKHQMLEE
ncbi:hypothetical protein TNCV_7181 [Trichonephila clavipes]|nr:hypothetical protein TNCV_7181 [Trichonephila clavipes]